MSQKGMQAKQSLIEFEQNIVTMPNKVKKEVSNNQKLKPTVAKVSLIQRNRICNAR